MGAPTHWSAQKPTTGRPPSDMENRACGIFSSLVPPFCTHFLYTFDPFCKSILHTFCTLSVHILPGRRLVLAILYTFCTHLYASVHLGRSRLEKIIKICQKTL